MNQIQPQIAVAEAYVRAADLLGLYAAVRVGPVGDGESISVMLTPGAQRTVYLDSTVRQRVCLMIICASRDRLRAADAAARLYNAVPRLQVEDALTVVEAVIPLSPPQEAGVEPDGRVIFTASVAVDFTTKG